MKMDNTWLIEKAYLRGEFIDAEKKFDVLNPATNDSIGKVPDIPLAQVEQAIVYADKTWNSWKTTPIGERSKLLQKLYQLTLEHREQLAHVMTLESGKPLQESLVEVDYAASFILWFAEEGKRAYGDTIPAVSSENKLFTIKQSVGVVAAITPWNFPLAMLTRKVAPALAAGCSVILKPASQTPFTALAFAKLAQHAGIPGGVFQVITSTNSQGVGKLLATSELIRKISFTGSTAVGRTLMEQAASTIKRTSMELGGNAPFIVFDDADISAAVSGAVAAKFRNAGQTCVSVNRFYVHDDVYEQFAEALTKEVSQLKVGNGMDDGVKVGPLINEKAVEKVKKHVEDAVGRGAKIQTGGSHLEGNFFSPTVLIDVHPDSLIATEETFGPVCALFRFATEAEAIDAANDTPFGLAAYFYSENVRRCHRVSEQLESGMVGINTGVISDASAPFGGVKQSGVGREGSHHGLDEYLEVKYISYGK
ncbi:NAD-dependent succinate-semialdehyde dehydrogenase [Sphingobacterium sp. lm-10]|uniref:NAD-dependent succinate-semialdehyde dehydrogenase n=1 Tax=Sphingobacterium sp. lm-10 TaxID=2944904 RepID=UPI0020224690|nr:NAD-dependent succinate-semialdehyde dehydrogenase [Sphingobacterium sp. lm-10]MCL7988013.1 NAD-dependent succinate-semialdehyde dehydrogenase [Sphingobacterium sp. lm-10]